MLKTPEPTVRIVIADDHIIFLEGLISLLKSFSWIEIIGTASNGELALKLLQTNQIDLLVTDINMPQVSGLELCQQVQKHYPSVSVLALTMHDEPKIINNILKAGAKGYVLKNTPCEELLEAIKTVAAGNVYIGQSVKQTLEAQSNSKERKTQFLPKLSKRENEILQLVAKELTTQEIADLLFISHHTVISHRKKLLFKFNVQNSAGLIKHASESGMLD